MYARFFCNPSSRPKSIIAIGMIAASPNGRSPVSMRHALIGAVLPQPACCRIGAKRRFSVHPPHLAYFKLVSTVRSKAALTTKAAPHQFDPSPLGLIAVILPGLNVALKSEVRTLQFAFVRSVS